MLWSHVRSHLDALHLQECQKQRALQAAAADLLAMQKLLALIADEDSCLEIESEQSLPGGGTGQRCIDAVDLNGPADADVDMEDAEAPAEGSNRVATDGDMDQASQRIRCSRQDSLEFVRS